MLRSHSRIPVPTLVATVVVAALGLSACGGGRDDERQVADVLRAGLTSKDPEVVCEGSLSGDLLRRVYGGAARCHRIEGKDAQQGNQARSAQVTDVKVDGERATAVVHLRGGDQDGARGALSLVAQDGDWRISDLSPALLRSQFEAGMRTDRELGAEIKRCIGERVLALGDAELRELAYGSIGERVAAQRRLVTMFGNCQASSPNGGGGAGDGTASVLRHQFEQGIAQSLRRDGAGAEAIACVNRRLRERIGDQRLVELIGAAGKEVPPDIAAATAGAMAACRAIG